MRATELHTPNVRSHSIFNPTLRLFHPSSSPRALCSLQALLRTVSADRRLYWQKILIPDETVLSTFRGADTWRGNPGAIWAVRSGAPPHSSRAPAAANVYVVVMVCPLQNPLPVGAVESLRLALTPPWLSGNCFLFALINLCSICVRSHRIR